MICNCKKAEVCVLGAQPAYSIFAYGSPCSTNTRDTRHAAYISMASACQQRNNVMKTLAFSAVVVSSKGRRSICPPNSVGSSCRQMAAWWYLSSNTAQLCLIGKRSQIRKAHGAVTARSCCESLVPSVLDVSKSRCRPCQSAPPHFSFARRQPMSFRWMHLEPSTE